MTPDPNRPTILHLAIDFNTPQRPRTTTAIEWFVGELDTFDNIVIAYRRTSSLKFGRPTPCKSNISKLFDFPFFGLRAGIGLSFSMWLAARRTIALLKLEGIYPDLVHAHKFTFEGLAGWHIARHFGVPFFVSLRGEVETKVFRKKPLIRPLLRRIAHKSARLYFVSAWFREEFYKYIPENRDRERLLPNIARNISPTIKSQPYGKKFVSVFNLDTWKRKGARWLLDGIAVALQHEPAIRLDIIGGGKSAVKHKIQKMINVRGLENVVTLVGHVNNADLLTRLPSYRGLLLPSLNETFGMVYIEALFSGIPILLTQGTAIDGYLEGLDIAKAVPPKDVNAIANAILNMWASTEELRANIVAAAPQLFARFDPNKSIATYKEDVNLALTLDQSVE